MKITTGTLIVLFAVAVSVSGTPAGELTPQQKRELSLLRREIAKVASITRRRKYDEARNTLDDIEERLKTIADEADLQLEGRELAATYSSLVRQRHGVAMREDPKKFREEQYAVSFVKHIVPILKDRCVECHADDPDGGLKLDSFANMKKGGKTGPLLVPGSTNRSLIMYRLAAPEQHRMPVKAAPLSRNELSLMALWINQGAKFDGTNEEHDLDELLDPKHVSPPKEYPKPTGEETVSFTKDIAPFMVDYCLRCHQGKKPSGELLLADFESMMKGGRHGRAIVPGDPEGSLMYQLMASYDEASRMPLEGKVTKKNFDDLATWIREGAKYDGETSRLHLRALNPGDSEMKAAELASLTKQQFEQFRKARSEAQWKKVLPEVEAKSVASPEIVFFGRSTTGRLTEVQKWADEHVATLRELFEIQAAQPVWRGRLAVFVFEDRGDFELFNQEIALRRVFEEDYSTAKVASTYEDAFIVLQDLGDKTDGTAPTLQFSLIQQLTSAYLATSDAPYPEWLTEGLGLALAANAVDQKDLWVDSFRMEVADSLSKLEKPIDVFHDGVFFSPEQARPVAMTLTQFLLKRGRVQNLAKLLKALKSSGDVDNSIRVVYGAEPDVIARAYLSALRIKRK